VSVRLRVALVWDWYTLPVGLAADFLPVIIVFNPNPIPVDDIGPVIGWEGMITKIFLTSSTTYELVKRRNSATFQSRVVLLH
jgi:hypothetical protein